MAKDMINERRILAIAASARGNSNTLNALQKLCPFEKYELIDLVDLNIGLYQYDGNYPSGDDFLSVATRMQESEVIVFATPVYWYSMSGLMKVFFDRFTDLITIQKPIGRGLIGKEAYLIAQGSEKALPEGFDVPFRRTCEYFKMNFCETFYMSVKSP
jgi:multimeric flavodoxin WrbA